MYIFINTNTEEISHPKSETHKGTREKWTHNACNYFFCLCGFLCKSYLFPPDYSVFKPMQTSFHGKSSLKCWEGKLLMPLWALPVRCVGLPAHSRQVSLKNRSPQRRSPQEIKRKCPEHILPVDLQIPIDCHQGQEAKQKAKQAACEVTTPKGKYYSISSLHRGSFPWYTPPLRRKKVCSLLYILHRSYTSQSIIQLRRIYIQSCVSQLHSQWPPDPTEMLICSSSLMLWTGRCWAQGILSFGLHSSRNPTSLPVSAWIPSILDSGQGLLTDLPGWEFPFKPRFHTDDDLSRAQARRGQKPSAVSRSLSLDTIPASLAHICEAQQMDGPGGVQAGAGWALSETGVHPWGIHPLDRWWREEGKRVLDARTLKFPFNPDLSWCWELLDLPFRSCHLTPSLLQCDTKWSSMNAPEVVQHMVPHFHKITSFLLVFFFF